MKRVNLLGLIATLILTICCSSKLVAGATPTPTNPLTDALSKTAPQFLPIDSAFSLYVEPAGQQNVRLNWQIAAGYYLYQNKIKIHLSSPLHASMDVTPPMNLLPGKRIQDPHFGEQIIYENILDISVPISQSWFEGGNPLTLSVGYQGCAAKGLCYPPQKKNYQINIVDGRISEITDAALSAESQSPAPEASSITKTQQEPSRLFKGSYLKVMATFYLFGILLSFTPCVLPMLPILSSVLIGQKRLDTRKAFLLSLCYTLSLSIVLTLFGSLAVLMGKNFQAMFQQTWIIILFSGLFIYLGLTQLGWVHLGLPHALHNKIHEFQSRFSAGSYINAIMMGAFAILIASPCVSAPLVGALSYISQTGDVALGAGALFMLGLGMGTILIIAGTLGGQFLPKAGNWMHVINKIFAAILFALSIWLLGRILPEWLSASLWITWCLIVATMLGTFSSWKQLPKLIGMVFVIYGFLLSITLIQGHTDPLQPLRGMTIPFYCDETMQTLAFEPIGIIDNLNSTLQNVKNIQTPALIKVTADWCNTCQKMKQRFFAKPLAKRKLTEGDWKLYKIDITKMDASKEDLLNQLNIYGPPVLLFYDKTGQEISGMRMVGEANLTEFLATVEKVQG